MNEVVENRVTYYVHAMNHSFQSKSKKIVKLQGIGMLSLFFIYSLSSHIAKRKILSIAPRWAEENSDIEA